MLKFKDFVRLHEALVPQHGENTGFREVHEFKHNGERHHAVVNITHNGDGHYKVVARVGKIGKVGFKNINPGPILGGKIAGKVKGTVETFMKDHDWNSITLGGVDSRTKEKYRSFANDLQTRDAEGKYDFHYPKGPLSAAVRISKKQKIEPTKLALSGTGEKSEYPGYDMKPRSSGSKSGSGNSSRGSSRESDESGKYGLSGLKGPSGPSKIDDTSAGLGASSALSAKNK